MRDAGRRGGHHAGRRPLRPRGAARARLDAGRRAVGPHHRHGLQRHRRRHRLRRCSRSRRCRARTWPTATPWRSCPSGWSTCASHDRDAAMASSELAEASEREARRPRGPRARARAPQRHRAARARHGRGAQRRRGRGGVRPPRRGRQRLVRRPAPQPAADGCSSGTSALPARAQHVDQRRRRDDAPRARPRGPRHARGVARGRPGQQLARRARATARRRAGRRRASGRSSSAASWWRWARVPAATRSPCSWASIASAPTLAGVQLAPQRDQAVVVLAPAQRARRGARRPSPSPRRGRRAR